MQSTRGRASRRLPLLLATAFLCGTAHSLCAQSGPVAASTPLSGPVGINTSSAYGLLDVWGGTGTNFVQKEIQTNQQDYQYNYLKLFKLVPGTNDNSVTITANICATRGDDIGVTQCAMVHASRNWDMSVLFSEQVVNASYTPFAPVTVQDGGATWFALLYDTHQGAAIASWSFSGSIFDWSSDASAISLNQISSPTAIHSSMSAPQLQYQSTSIPYGALGIGTLTPSAPLEVNGNIKISANSGGAITFADGSTIKSANQLPVGTITAGIWNGSPITQAYLPSNLEYVDAPQTITAQKIFMGGVGVGTTTPVGQLSNNSVNYGDFGSGGDAGSFNWRMSAVGSGGWNSISSAGSNGLVVATDQTTGAVLQVSSGPYNPQTDVRQNHILTVLGGGNVGIGTTSPSTELEVNGSITLTQGTGASLVFQDGTVQSTAYLGSACSLGPPTAPQLGTSCQTNGSWVFSQDGHARVCLNNSWTLPSTQ